MGKVIKNPCVGKCHDYDELKELCRACKMTREDSARWYKLSDKEKRKIIECVKKRRGGRADEGGSLENY